MRLIVERVVLLLCAYAAITSAQYIQNLCLQKVLLGLQDKVCNFVAGYCLMMGLKVFTDEVEDFQCPEFCEPQLLTETFVTCEECKNSKPNEYNENCPVSTNLKIVEDTLVIGEDLFRALHTLPYGFFVSKSTIEGAGLGVFTQMDLLENLRFGPYEGSIHDIHFDDKDAHLYSWKIDENSIVNALNVSYSNWLRYVNMPNCQKDENMFAVYFKQQIYYVTLNPIKAGSELLVWYGEKYALHLRLHEFNCD